MPNWFASSRSICSPENIEVGMQFERGGEDDDSDEMLYTITDIADGKVVVGTAITRWRACR